MIEKTNKKTKHELIGEGLYILSFLLFGISSAGYVLYRCGIFSSQSLFENFVAASLNLCVIQLLILISKNKK